MSESDVRTCTNVSVTVETVSLRVNEGNASKKWKILNLYIVRSRVSLFYNKAEHRYISL